MYNENKQQNRTVSVASSAQPAARASYAAAAARNVDNVDQTSRGNIDAPSNVKQKVSFSYNPNGITLDKSELESIVFSQMFVGFVHSKQLRYTGS